MSEQGQHNKEIGRRGEDAAVHFLMRRGFDIVDRNWKCPAGEVDIIAEDGDTLVFCEVKTRTSLKRGMPSEAVTPEKRKRYEKIAAWYLRECGDEWCRGHGWDDHPIWFDVISILVVGEDRAILRHDVNAFGFRD